MLKKGRGVSMIMHPTGFKGGGDPNQAFVRLRKDGTLDLIVGDTELGQGIKTVAIQYLAETMNIDFAKISFSNDNSKFTSHNACTAASRTTWVAGHAIMNAAKDLKEKMIIYASKKMEVAAGDLAFQGEKIVSKTNPDMQMTFAEIGTQNVSDGEVLVGLGGYLSFPFQAPDPESGRIDGFGALAYGAIYVDVAVDTETGEFTIEGMYSAYDVGTVVNPDLAAGQVWGGNGMGFGMTAMEDLLPNYPNVDNRPDNFTDYVIPTAADMAFPTKNEFVENYDPEGPLGAKGFAEMTASPQAPAIANAIYNACGARITDLPITPERILRALDKV